MSPRYRDGSFSFLLSVVYPDNHSRAHKWKKQICNTFQNLYCLSRTFTPNPDLIIHNLFYFFSVKHCNEIQKIVDILLGKKWNIREKLGSHFLNVSVIDLCLELKDLVHMCVCVCLWKSWFFWGKLIKGCAETTGSSPFFLKFLFIIKSIFLGQKVDIFPTPAN